MHLRRLVALCVLGILACGGAGKDGGEDNGGSDNGGGDNGGGDNGGGDNGGGDNGGGCDTWYDDIDGDGYGNPDTAEVTCDPAADQVDNGDDCNDLDSHLHPGMREVCDNVDNDCDGAMDDADDDLDTSTGTTWYLDDDGDGYAGSEHTTQSCRCPADGSAEPFDCDDDNPEVSPAAEEICDNGLDDDCDGEGGTCELGHGETPASADVSFTGGSRDYEVATSVAFAGDFNGDGREDVLIGMPNRDQVGGAALFRAPFVDPESTDSADLILDPSGSVGHIGLRVIGLGDMDGDGYDDIAYAGADWTNGSGEEEAGYVGFARGRSSGSPVTTSVYGAAVGLECGTHLSVGDLSGDGAPDLLVGCSSSSTYGAAFLFRSVPSRAAEVQSAADVVLMARGTGAPEVAAILGDMTGDGVDELIMGTAYLAGPVTADLDIEAEGVAGVAGHTEWVGGDLDGDGYGDAVDDQGGIFFGSSTFGGPTGDPDVDVATDTVVAMATGDLNGDGYDDLIRDHYGLGIWYGGATVSRDPATLECAPGCGQTAGSIDVADVNGDGVGDLLFGSPVEGRDGYGPGSAYLFYGGSR